MRKNRTSVTISAAIATFNEENNIVDCINSLKKLSKDIVVVDGQSKDRTVELATSLGARVISAPNNPMFHINKNLAIKNCKGDWILLLDADERLSDELTDEIKRTIKSKPKENGFWLNRSNWFLGGYLKKGGAYPDPVIRLFKNGKGILPEVSVHEQVSIKGDVGQLESNLIHFADPSFERYLTRANRYTDQTAAEFHEKNLQINTLSNVYYMIFKPIIIFLKLYIRHKGYQDGFRGFVWALFSASHFYYAYTKYISKQK
jgi:glycosyltransferase involved in cell wall biosynthesis